MNMKGRQIIGLMSGTSLDGLDIAWTEFKSTDGVFSYKIHKAATIKWSKTWQTQLAEAKHLSGLNLVELDKALGKEIGLRVNTFIAENNIDKNEISAIASHGHTIFHQPSKGYSWQIGCGTSIAFETGIQVINDFRNKDILAGGQGAPLVPIGDQMLFSNQAEAFLNLGGISNITFQNEQGKWIAFDISPCNIPLNKLAEQRNQAYDKGGKLAEKGVISTNLLHQLNQLPYYQIPSPKSLGIEWIDENFYPLFNWEETTEDNLCTVVEHIAIQIGTILEKNKIKSVLITGGGAYNDFLINRIQNHSLAKIIVPDSILVDFKEALIFAFLGELYLSKLPNTVPSVTGAKRSCVSGVLHLPD